jgi:hypothetical protein
MNDYDLKCEMVEYMLWVNNNDQKNDDELWSEKGSAIVMREETGSKERRWIEKINGKCDCYERRRRIKRTIINWEVKREMQ